MRVPVGLYNRGREFFLPITTKDICLRICYPVFFSAIPAPNEVSERHRNLYDNVSVLCRATNNQFPLHPMLRKVIYENLLTLPKF